MREHHQMRSSSESLDWPSRVLSIGHWRCAESVLLQRHALGDTVHQARMARVYNRCCSQASLINTGLTAEHERVHFGRRHSAQED